MYDSDGLYNDYEASFTYNGSHHEANLFDSEAMKDKGSSLWGLIVVVSWDMTIYLCMDKLEGWITEAPMLKTNISWRIMALEEISDHGK